MAAHRKPRNARGKSRRRVPLAGVAVLGLLAGATAGGVALAANPAPHAAKLNSAWVTAAMVDSFARGVPDSGGGNVLVYACLASGKLTGVSVTARRSATHSTRGCSPCGA